jgi:hypothetical protein
VTTTLIGAMQAASRVGKSGPISQGSAAFSGFLMLDVP